MFEKIKQLSETQERINKLYETQEKIKKFYETPVPLGKAILVTGVLIVMTAMIASRKTTMIVFT